MTTYYKKEIMAININKVYKSVLSILNKEQRGYLTPYEYNNLAKQAQLELLDNLFYEYNKFSNLENVNRTNESYGDLATRIEEQIDEFYKQSSITVDNTTGEGTLPTDLYKVINVTTSNQNIEVEKIDKNRLPYLLSSNLTAPSVSFPIYYQRATDLVVNPTSISSVLMQYIKMPAEPRFGYTTNTQYGTNIYDDQVFVEGGLIIGNTLTIPTVTATNAGITSPLATTAVSPSTGTGAKIQLTTGGGNITEAKVINAGSGYKVGDVIKITDAVMEADNTIGLTGGDLNITIGVNDLYNTTTRGSTNFELHPSMETNLIITILGYAGLIIKDAGLVQAATQIGATANIQKTQQ